MTDDQVAKISRAIRFISHGEEQPAGLEMLAMAVSGSTHDGSLADAMAHIAEAIEEVSMSINRVANAMENGK